MDMITVLGENALLDPETNTRIAEYERRMKELKAQEEELKTAIKEEMERKGIKKIETDDIIISYIAPTDRETFDSKALKKDLPTLYDDYVSITPVKASIRIKLR